ncbi:hypothetical protein JTE90_021011 [Oedothorax gibbosus]|uniref:Uncharacterized protein n=1 Tax=Oedothorax gibbosus TaxID=931172 RepID=A0AAV6U3S4_9ARAC|nr:hypothetical protein JTE90_021011 [Oedothorax gibbosus]
MLRLLQYLLLQGISRFILLMTVVQNHNGHRPPSLMTLASNRMSKLFMLYTSWNRRKYKLLVHHYPYEIYRPAVALSNSSLRRPEVDLLGSSSLLLSTSAWIYIDFKIYPWIYIVRVKRIYIDTAKENTKVLFVL